MNSLVREYLTFKVESFAVWDSWLNRLKLGCKVVNCPVFFTIYFTNNDDHIEHYRHLVCNRPTCPAHRSAWIRRCTRNAEATRHCVPTRWLTDVQQCSHHSRCGSARCKRVRASVNSWPRWSNKWSLLRADEIRYTCVSEMIHQLLSLSINCQLTHPGRLWRSFMTQQFFRRSL